MNENIKSSLVIAFHVFFAILSSPSPQKDLILNLHRISLKEKFDKWIEYASRKMLKFQKNTPYIDIEKPEKLIPKHNENR